MTLLPNSCLPVVATAFRRVAAAPCAFHIGMHYRAGDVFTGINERPNFRTMPMHFISAALNNIENQLRENGIQDVKSYLFTELTPPVALQAKRALPNTIIMPNSADEFEHIAVAAKCDLLILGYSAFSWILSLTNPTAVILPFEKGKEKYKSSKYVMHSLNDTATLSVAMGRMKTRCALWT